MNHFRCYSRCICSQTLPSTCSGSRREGKFPTKDRGVSRLTVTLLPVNLEAPQALIPLDTGHRPARYRTSGPNAFSGRKDPVSIYPCSSCGQRQHGKLATVYSAWFDADGKREAWKQRFCAPCLTTLTEGFRDSLSLNMSDVTVCPLCGADASINLDPIYLTLYLPKREPVESALCTCASCAPSLRNLLRVGAQALADRQEKSQGLSNGAPGSDPWEGFPS